jgi:hypothetical protein
MKAWLALLGTPCLALGNLSAAYALVTPSCANQTSAALHAVSIFSLVASLALWGLVAVGGSAPHGRDDGGDPAVRHRFVRRLARWTAPLFSLVIAAQWFCIWVLSPCVS